MLKIKPRKTLALWFVFMLFLFSNITAFFHLVWLIPPFVLVETIVFLILAVISIRSLLAQKKISSLFAQIKRHWFILPFLIYAGFSIFWSVKWDVSLYRWLILLSTLVAGAYLGLCCSLDEIREYLSGFGFLIMFLSTVLVVFMPYVGVMDYHSIQGAWKGVFWHKNHMGLLAVFINIVFLLGAAKSDRSLKERLFWGALYLFSLYFIYRTDSVAAYLTTIFLHGVIILAVLWMRFRDRFRGVHYVVISALLVAVALILFLNLDVLFGIFNRNTTLTGRIPMWSYLFENYFSQRPFFGYGFNAFWYIPSHREVLHLVTGYPDPIVIADNGFIDILVNTGFVGFGLFIIFYLGIWWRAIRSSLVAETILGFFPVIVMAYTLIANITWSLIFENESFFMLLMFVVLFHSPQSDRASTETF